MPQPGQIGNIVPKQTDPGAIMRIISDMQAQIKALQGALIVNGLTVNGAPGIVINDGGALTVNDPSGNPRIVLGQLVSGDFGLEIISSSGQVLPLEALAFGTVATSNATTFGCPGNATWRTDATDVPLTVQVTTGRLLITVSAVQFTSISAANAVQSWSLTGPTAVGPDNQRGLVTCCASFPASGYSSSSYSFLHVGLTPGSYTVTPQYRCDQFGGTSDEAFFEARTVIAQPF